jgi:uncharacterized protein (TIGR03086 family)
MDIVEQYGRALDQTGRIVEGIRPDQLGLPTPCTDWNVRTLLNHLIGGNWRTARAAEGQGSPAQRGVPDEDFLGDDPAEAYRRSAEAAKAAWREPGRLDRLYEMPIGAVPGQAVLTLRLVEAITHGWDLARATEQPAHFDDDLIHTAMGFTQASIGRARSSGSPFAPPVEVEEHLPAIDRLAALTGRRP